MLKKLKKLFYFIVAKTFNSLIIRKEMCHWSKGVELKEKVNYLEKWLNENNLQNSGAHETLKPIIEVSELLQARKSNSDIKSLCEICNNLTIPQIQRILYMYTPIEVYEEKLSQTFIDQVMNSLKSTRSNETSSSQQILTFDPQKQFPVYVPYSPSSICLESIEIPVSFKLENILKKI